MATTRRFAGIKERRGRMKTIGCCGGMPLIFLLCVFFVYTYNNRLPDIVVPTHSVPADNARDYFHRSYNLSRAMKHLTPYDMTLPEDGTLANFRGCAIDAKPALAVFRQGLGHPYMAPAERTYQLVVPPIESELRELARIDAGAADYYLLTGDSGTGMRMKLDCMEMGVMVPRGGGLIAFLVGRAGEAIAAEGIEQLIPRLSRAQLAVTSARFERIESKRVPFSDILQETGYIDAAVALDLLRHPTRSQLAIAASQLYIGQETDVPFGERASESVHTIREMFVNKNAKIKQDLEVYSLLARIAQKPYSTLTTAQIPGSANAASTISWFNTARAQYVSAEAALAILRVETALYQYKQVHGKFPTNLAELCPTYLRTVPGDPFGPQASAVLHYSIKSGGSGILLYSIGPDMKDDGGAPAKRLGELGGDIVAGKLYNRGPSKFAPIRGTHQNNGGK